MQKIPAWPFPIINGERTEDSQQLINNPPKPPSEYEKAKMATDNEESPL